MSNVEHYEIEWLQDQIYNLLDSVRDLENKVDQLQMDNNLLRNDLNTIKIEGCWRYVDDSNHTHRRANE